MVMIKTFYAIILILLLSACKSSNYVEINQVDGYPLYQKEPSGFHCESKWEDIYYSGEVYNYGFRYTSCSADKSFFIIDENGDYIYIRDALSEGIISLESLIPLLTELKRNPEEFSSSKADYYWLDFHIGPNVVYAYAGGPCDEEKTETFIINNATYTYTASGCLKDNILFLRIDGEEQPISTLLKDGTIQGEVLIPLLKKQNE